MKSRKIWPGEKLPCLPTVRIFALVLTLAVMVPFPVSVSAAGSGSTSTLTTEVPAAHAVELVLEGKGTVRADGRGYRESGTMQIPRLSEQTYQLVPDDGWKVGSVSYGSGEETGTGMVSGNTFTAPALREDGNRLHVIFEKKEDSSEDGGAENESGGSGGTGGKPDGTDDTGKGTDDTGKGTDDTGKGMDDTGKGTDDTGKGMDDTGKGTDDTGKGMDDTGKGTDDTGKGTDGTNGISNSDGHGKGSVQTGDRAELGVFSLLLLGSGIIVLMLHQRGARKRHKMPALYK